MICLSLQQNDFKECCELAFGRELVEIRADLCRFSLEELGELLQVVDNNAIMTCRIESSSEQYALERLFFAIRAGVRYVDVEIEAPEAFMNSVSSEIEMSDTQLIISYHNFEGTESRAELDTIYNKCKALGADVVKIVTTAQNIADCANVMSLYKGKKRGGITAFSMGELGKFTRQLALDLGAPFTYTSAGNGAQTASGQYTYDEMREIMSDENYPFIFENIEVPTSVTIPCSKSVAQRAIVAAALCRGTSVLRNYAPCNDIDGALDVVRSMGCEVEILDSVVKITGIQNFDIKEVNVRESGLLTRLMIPLSSYIAEQTGEVSVIGHGSILKRNLKESIVALRSAGVESNESEYLPIVVKSGIRNRVVRFSGSASSQIVSGFLMTLPLCKFDSELIIENPVSVPYIELTLRVLADFGIKIQCVENTTKILHYKIAGAQQYSAVDLVMDGDWSSAAPFVVAGAIKGEIELSGLKINSLQADEKILEIAEMVGLDVKINEGVIKISRNGALNAFKVDLKNAPDLFPILSLLAVCADGVSELSGVSRLLQKESNRAQTIFSEFSVLGADIDIKGDTIYIKGSELMGGNVRSHNDHRIAMTMIIAALCSDGAIALDDTKCLDKSFPSFLKLLNYE